RTLKPGGMLMLHGYRPEQITYGTGGPPHAENMYTEEMLREGFCDMRILHLAAYDCEIEEGKGHAGMSALIDLVAVKR
ncbi:SAM-dependent methyltransferase, partial [Paracoccus aurantiacus]